MYFAVNKNGYSGYGKTLTDAVSDLTDQDEAHEIKDLEFYKAQLIKVELKEVPIPIEVPKVAVKKK